MAFIKSCYIDSRTDLSPKCEVVCEKGLTSEIFCPTHTCLPQSAEHQSDDQEVVGSDPTGSNFFGRISFALSDNAGRIPPAFDRSRRIAEKLK